MVKDEMIFGATGVGARMIDLRSDVVTKPSRPMLRYMCRAEVGNDGWREDPTVRRFEHAVALLFGKEAALITPSGTMANEIAIRLLAPRGSEVLVERTSHLFNYEVAGPAALSGVQLVPIEGHQGVLTWADISRYVRPRFHQFPRTACVSLEHPHNNSGGRIYPLEDIELICARAHGLGIRMHLDGSRIFNACVETKITPRHYAAGFDLVNVCLSKGLGCPGGSVLLGSKKLIDEAILIRRQFGGSMRQITGYMAAAGLYALKHNITRLKKDNQHARQLARIIQECNGLELLAEPQTNIVIFRAKRMSPEKVCLSLRRKGVVVAPYNYPILRAVFHLDVTDEDLGTIRKCFHELFA
jgi:threonine aldolase